MILSNIECLTRKKTFHNIMPAQLWHNAAILLIVKKRKNLNCVYKLIASNKLFLKQRINFSPYRPAFARQLLAHEAQPKIGSVFLMSFLYGRLYSARRNIKRESTFIHIYTKIITRSFLFATPQCRCRLYIYTLALAQGKRARGKIMKNHARKP